MIKKHGRLLSGALATALTVANMGALMPITAYAEGPTNAGTEALTWTISDGTDALTTVYTGQKFKVGSTWEADLGNGDEVNITADKNLKGSAAIAAGTSIISKTGTEETSENNIVSDFIEAETAGDYKFTLDYQAAGSESELIKNKNTKTVSIIQSAITGITAEADIGSAAFGTPATITATATETFNYEVALEDIVWGVYDISDTEYKTALVDAFVYTDAPSSAKTTATTLEEPLTVKTTSQTPVGDYVIHAATKDSDFSADIPFSVVDANAKVTVGKYSDDESIEKAVNESLQLYAYVNEVKTTSGIDWKSSDETIATVDSSGKVTAKKTGTATITAEYNVTDDVVATGSFTLTVVSVDLKSDIDAVYDENGEESSSSDYYPGYSMQLKTMYGTTDVTSEATYSSDAASVATVSSTGLIKAVGAGEATITYKYGSYKKTLDVTVTELPAASYKVESDSDLNKIWVGSNTAELYVTYAGEKITNNVQWSSSDVGKATVDTNGVVKGIAAGTATITAKFIVNGETKEASKDVTVKAAAWELVDSNDTHKLLEDESYNTKWTAEMIVGDTMEITSTYGGESFDGTWATSTPTLVKINNDVITAKSNGSATVTYKADLNEDGDTSDANETVTLTITVTDATLTLEPEDGETDVEKDATLQLKAYWGVEDITEDSNVKYSSSKTSIATVSDTGLVTGVSEGHATIKVVYSLNGEAKNAEYDIDVIAATQETTLAQEAAQAANDAADKALAAAQAAEANPTAETVAAAKTAAQAAEAAAEAALDAAEDTSNAAAKKAAEDAADAATAAAKTATDAATAAQAKVDEATKKAEEEKKAAEEKAAEEKKAADEKKAEEEKKAAEEKAAADKKTADQAVNATGTDATTGTSYKVTDTTAKTVGFTGSTSTNKKQTIPSSVVIDGDTFAVTSIEANAFKDSAATEITIGSNITKIDPSAFKGSKVKKVNVKGTKLTKTMAKAFNKLKKNSTIKVTGANKKANKKLLNNLKNVKNGKIKVK